MKATLRKQTVTAKYVFWVRACVTIMTCLMVRPVFAETKTFYIHNDHLGTPQVVTAEDRKVIWEAAYTPFGEIASVREGDVKLTARFPGQRYEEESGYYYNYFRDYDPSLGRYLQSDPIGLSGGINTYAYVSGNPLSLIDPLGLAWTPGQVGMGYGEEWDELNIPPKGDDPCGCFAEAFFGYAEASIVATEAATGPYVGKPRGGIAGGGPSGTRTSAISSAVHQVNKQFGKSAFTAAVRGAGRFGSRFVPYVGTGLLAYDISVYNKCIEECDEEECNR